MHIKLRKGYYIYIVYTILSSVYTRTCYMYRKGRTNNINYTQTKQTKKKSKCCTVKLITTHALMPRQFPSSKPQAAVPPVYKMRMTSYSMEYLFGQLWSAVLAVCPPRFLCPQVYSQLGCYEKLKSPRFCINTA